MKKTLVSIALLGATLTMAQVGINTEEPKATLDVVASPSNMSIPDGVIAPRMTGDEIKAKDLLYDTPQTGAIVYATAAVGGTPAGKTINIIEEGYYYFDGLVWTKFGSGTGTSGAEPWFVQGTTNEATANSENIYQQGKVAVGFSDTDAVSGKQFEVKGDVKAVANNAGTYSILETNNTAFGLPFNMMMSADNTDILTAANYGAVTTNINDASLSTQGVNGNSSVGAMIIPTVGPKSEILTSNSVTNVANRITLGSNGATEQVDKIILRSENIPASTATRILVDKAEGVTFKYGGIANPSGNYTFPQNNGTAGQVLVTNGAASTLMTGAQLSWQNVSDLIQNNDWHITGNTDIVAGTNFLGTTSANKVALEFRVNGERAGYIGDDNTNTAGAQGLYKTTLGYQAGMGTTGDRVTAIGNLALSQNTANNNTAIGAFALQKNVTGQNNMAVGDQTLLNNTARRNTAVGSTALTSNTTGEANTAIGYRGGANNISGAFNTFIGSHTGITNTTGSKNILIGSRADIADGLTNSIAIGYLAKAEQSNSILLGALVGTYNIGTPTSPTWETVSQPTNVGIGTATPSNALHVVATADPLKLEGLQAGTATDEVLVVNNNVVKKVTAGSLVSSLEPWQNQSDATKATSNTAAIYQTGNVSIGSQNPIVPFTSNGSTITPKLSVTGDVASTGAFYTNTGKYADYVFEDYFDGSSTINEDYKFMSLDETAAYIKENKHLPGVTPIKDVLKTESGYTVNLSELSIQQLEKIEELYLHTIEQQQEIENQKKEINDLKSRFAELEALLLKENNNK